MSESYERLFLIAEEFGEIAQNVNKSSQLRKEHSEKAIQNLDLSFKSGTELLEEIQKISKENLSLRDKNNIILSSCRIFLANLAKQDEILKQLAGSSIPPGILAKVDNYKSKLNDSLNVGLNYLNKIIETNNEIILMDNLIIKRKNFQKERIEKLKESTGKILNDAVIAIEGSQSNLGRGASLMKRFREIEFLVKEKNKPQIQELADESKTGCMMASQVNESSRSQFEFAEKVNLFTKHLHDESLFIKDLILKKSELFNKNLEPIAELAVLVAVEMFEYLSIKEYVKDLNINDITLGENTYNLLNNLAAYIISICENVESVAVLNFDMSDSIAANADLERKAADLTQKEISYYSSVKDAVAAMTEATKYPVEGSAKNIENGKELVKLLEEISEKL